jgi:DNA replication protein DnaC
MNRSLVFDLATGAFIARHEDGLFLGPPGTGKSHLAQAIGQAAIQQGYRVLYRETHKLLDDLAEATIDATRKECMELFVSVPLLIIDDLGMWKLPMTAAEDLLEIVMRRYGARQHFAHLESSCGRLGQTARRQRRRYRHARSSSPSWPRT